MVKFGRKFFFDKAHKKKNHTIPLIIAGVLIVAITTTLLVIKFSKNDEKPKIKETIVTINKTLEIEIYSELPNKEDYFKKLENIKVEDFEISYPENLSFVDDISGCENKEDTANCKKQLATTIGEYKITLKSEKLEDKEYNVTLKVIDTTKPTLALKEVTITEGETYTINNFINTCEDNSKTECTYEYFKEDKDKDGNVIDYSKFTSPGTYEVKIYAIDSSNNKSEVGTTKLTINKKKTTTNDNKETNNPPKNEETTKPKTCKYGDLKYSSSYVIAVKIESTDCAISAEEAEALTNKAGIKFNKVLAKEIQASYLEKEISKLNLQGQISYEITYGPVFNTTNKGVVGYYLASEAKQTVDGKTTTIARYFINENGNRVWKVNNLNLK